MSVRMNIPFGQISVPYRLEIILGGGAFGKVYQYSQDCSIHPCAPFQVAVKNVEIQQKFKGAELDAAFSKMIAKVNVCGGLRHDNLVKYFNCFSHKPTDGISTPSLRIVMEFCPGGTLDACISAVKEHSSECIRQILQGLVCLHSNNIVHTDVKPSNILISSASGFVVLKIADYADPCFLESEYTMTNDITELRGTSSYYSPEMAAKWTHVPTSQELHKVGRKTDVWSLGCVLLDILLEGETREYTVEGKPIDVSSFGTFGGVYHQVLLAGGLPVIPTTFAENEKNFLSVCLKRDPTLRSECQKLLSDPFIKESQVSILQFNDILQRARKYISPRIPDEDPESKTFKSPLRFSIPNTESEIICTVGRLVDTGSFGEVHGARADFNLAEVLFYAIRVWKPIHCPDPSSLLGRLSELTKLRNNNVVKYLAYSQLTCDQLTTNILMEFQSGNLMDLLERHVIPSSQGLAYIKQIVEGLAFLHQNKVVHTNLTPRKIHWIESSSDSHERIMKISGLECPLAYNSIRVKRSMEDLKISLHYMSPEMALLYLHPEKTGSILVKERTDIWSIGCIALDILLGIEELTIRGHIIENKSLERQMIAVSQGRAQQRRPRLTLQKRFVEKCLVVNQAERATAEILRMFPLNPSQLTIEIEGVRKESLTALSTRNCTVKEMIQNGVVHVVATPEFITHLEQGGNDSEYIRDLQQICSQLSKHRIALGLQFYRNPSMELKNVITSVSHQVAFLTFSTGKGWTGKILHGIHLPHIREIQFWRVQDVSLRKVDVEGLQSLRIITFLDSTIALLEENIFEELPLLEYVGLNLNSVTEGREETLFPLWRKINLSRYHFNPTFAWLHEYFKANPTLRIEPTRRRHALWEVGGSCELPYEENEQPLNGQLQNFKEFAHMIENSALDTSAMMKLFSEFGTSKGEPEDGFALLVTFDGGWLRIGKDNRLSLMMIADGLNHDASRLFTTLCELKNPLFVTLEGKDFSGLSDMLSPIKDLVLHLSISRARDFTASHLSQLCLDHLIMLHFYECTEITLQHGDLSGMPNIRAILLDNTTVASIEENVFSRLSELQFVAVDLNLLSDTESKRQHLQRFHHSPEYTWLREFFKENPCLIEEKLFGELWNYTVDGEIIANEAYAEGDAFKKNVQPVIQTKHDRSPRNQIVGGVKIESSSNSNRHTQSSSDSSLSSPDSDFDHCDFGRTLRRGIQNNVRQTFSSASGANFPFNNIPRSASSSFADNQFFPSSAASTVSASSMWRTSSTNQSRNQPDRTQTSHHQNPSEYVRKVRISGSVNVTIEISTDRLFSAPTSAVSSDGFFNISNISQINGGIFTDFLTDIEVSGSAKLTVTSRFSTQRLAISTSGSSVVQVTFSVEDLRILASGSSMLSLSGDAGRCEFTTSGNARLCGRNLRVQDVVIRATGESEIQALVVGSLKGRASGQARVMYSGNPLVSVASEGQATVFPFNS